MWTPAVYFIAIIWQDTRNLWEVKDVLDVRGPAEEQEILVRWDGWNGPDQWLKAAHQPELTKYLSRNRANPYSSTYAAARVRAAQPLDLPEDLELLSIRQAIFDGLSGHRATPNGQVGWQSRIHIQVPFSLQAFETHFRSLDLDQIPIHDRGNVSCYITHKDLTQVLGKGWASRGCRHTSTVAYINPAHKIRLTWSFKERVNYDHSACPR